MADSLAKVLEELSKRGVTLNAKQKETLNESLATEFREAAEIEIQKHLKTDSEIEKVETAEKYAETLFSLASGMRKDFTEQKKNRGRGERYETVVTIETTEGELKVVLSRPTN